MLLIKRSTVFHHSVYWSVVGEADGQPGRQRWEKGGSVSRGESQETQVQGMYIGP